MSEIFTLIRKDNIALVDPLGERVGADAIFCKACGDCIARMRPLMEKYGTFNGKIRINGDIDSLAEIQCTSFMNGGRPFAQLTRAFTFQEGTILESFKRMDELERELPCLQYPDFVNTQNV